MVSPLPQELIDQILSFVTDDKTLRICSRTCRAWAPVAQGRLFEDITIHYKEDADKFLGLLNASPHIARLPRLLVVVEGRRRQRHEEKYAEGFLVKMASRLVNVGVLQISGTDVQGFPEQSAQSLCEGFLRVERLAFCGSELDASWVLSFLRTHSDIRHLLFSSGSIHASELPLSPLPPTVPHLHTLSVSYTLGIRLVLPFLCIQENNQLPPSITELHLNPLNEADEAAGCQLVLKLKDVLRTLVLGVSMSSSPSHEESCKGAIERLSLQKLSALTTFVADSIILNCSFPDTYRWVQQALWDLRGAPLETVRIRMWHLSVDTVQNFDWVLLESTLNELHHLRLLRFELWGNGTRATMSEIIREKMQWPEDSAWQVEFVGPP